MLCAHGGAGASGGCGCGCGSGGGLRAEGRDLRGVGHRLDVDGLTQGGDVAEPALLLGLLEKVSLLVQ